MCFIILSKWPQQDQIILVEFMPKELTVSLMQDVTDSTVGISGEKGEQKLITPLLRNYAVECTVLAIKHFQFFFP